jgi:hypothetical protein
MMSEFVGFKLTPEVGDIFAANIYRQPNMAHKVIFIRLLRLIQQKGDKCVGAFEVLETKETRQNGLLVDARPTVNAGLVFNFAFTIKDYRSIVLTSYDEDGEVMGTMEFARTELPTVAAEKRHQSFADTLKSDHFW